MEYGPINFSRLITNSKVRDVQKHHHQDIIVVSTEKQTLECHYIKKTNNKQCHASLLKMKQMKVQCNPTFFAITDRDIVHIENDLLKINNRYQLKHQANINHLITDSENIALTTSKDKIRINSIDNNNVVGQMKHPGQDITSIYWNNSLVISGNNAGFLDIWDINKQHIVNSKQASNSSIDIINVYTDLIDHNMYYAFCKDQRKIYFYDLRSYRPVGILQNLPKTTKDIKNNDSGKVFIMSDNILSFLDIYKGFSLIGKFTQLKQQFQSNFLREHPNGQIYHRSLVDMLIWDQYVLLGSNNGCIEVYNSDLYKCSYAFGMAEHSGIKKLMRIDDSLLALQQSGGMTMAKMI